MKKSVLFIVFFSLLTASVACVAKTVTWYTWSCTNCHEVWETNHNSPPNAYQVSACRYTPSQKHNFVRVGSREVVDPGY